MKMPLRLRKTVDLLEEYQEVASIQKSLNKALGTLPEGIDIPTRVEAARELASNRVKKLKLLLEFIRRFSPSVGKELQLKLKRTVKTNEEYLKKAAERQDLPQTVRKGFITDAFGLELIDQWITLAFSSIVETMQTARLPLLLQKNEHLELALRKFNPKYEKMYTAAWQTLKSSNLDACRQCASSLRQLLIDLINAKGTGKDRESKINDMFKHEEDEKVRKAIVSFVKATISLLGKTVHKDIGLKNMSFAMIMTEDALLFLLDHDGD